jgi:hypothetical protein
LSDFFPKRDQAPKFLLAFAQSIQFVVKFSAHKFLVKDEPESQRSGSPPCEVADLKVSCGFVFARRVLAIYSVR